MTPYTHLKREVNVSYGTPNSSSTIEGDQGCTETYTVKIFISGYGMKRQRHQRRPRGSKQKS
jgi:hypothetical protein